MTVLTAHRPGKPTVSAEDAAKVIESLLRAIEPAKGHFSLVACAKYHRAETLVHELRGKA